VSLVRKSRAGRGFWFAGGLVVFGLGLGRFLGGLGCRRGFVLQHQRERWIVKPL